MRKRIGAALLLCLLLSTMLIPPALGAEGATPPSAAIVVTRVTGTDFIEVSLTAEAEVFVSADTVLSYDTTKLRPVDFTGQPLTANAGTGLTTVPTKAADRMALKPALAYRSTEAGRACLYLSAGSQNPEAVGTGEKLVTVRFQYIGTGTEDEKKADLADRSFGTTGALLRFAAQDEATRSMVPGALSCTTAIGATRTVWVHGAYDSVNYPNNLAEVPWTVADGPSVAGSGGSAMGGGYAITFFDWDGRVIDAITASKDATETLQTFTDSLKADEKSPLNTKLGYAFDRWLLVDETATGLAARYGTFSSNDSPISEENPDTDLRDVVSPGDLSKLTSGTSLLLQAAYRAKTTAAGDESDLVNNGSGSNLDRYYSISEPVYSRYGSADANNGSYSLKLTAYRNSDPAGTGYGVTRLREPAIIVTMTSKADGKNIVSLIRLDNTDVAEFEVVPTKQISAVSYKVVDIYGVTNWPGSADKSNPNVSKDSNTFIREGTRGFLAQQAGAVKTGAAWDSTVTNQAFADAYLGENPTRANPAWWNENRCATAKEALKTAVPVNGTQLTSAEVKTALDKVS